MTDPGTTPDAADDRVARSATVTNRKGLHARAAARLARLAENFDADITVACRGHRVSALSIMGLLMLGAAHGTVITIGASGADAEAAVDALARLVENGFDEDDDG